MKFHAMLYNERVEEPGGALSSPPSCILALSPVTTNSLLGGVAQMGNWKRRSIDGNSSAYDVIVGIKLVMAKHFTAVLILYEIAIIGPRNDLVTVIALSIQSLVHTPK